MIPTPNLAAHSTRSSKPRASRSSARRSGHQTRTLSPSARSDPLASSAVTMLIISRRRLEATLREYAEHFNGDGPHRGARRGGPGSETAPSPGRQGSSSGRAARSTRRADRRVPDRRVTGFPAPMCMWNEAKLSLIVDQEGSTRQTSVEPEGDASRRLRRRHQEAVFRVDGRAALDSAERHGCHQPGHALCRCLAAVLLSLPDHSECAHGDIHCHRILSPDCLVAWVSITRQPWM